MNKKKLITELILTSIIFCMEKVRIEFRIGKVYLRVLKPVGHLQQSPQKMGNRLYIESGQTYEN